MLDEVLEIIDKQNAYESILLPDLRVKINLSIKSSLSKDEFSEQEFRDIAVNLGYKSLNQMQNDFDKLLYIGKEIREKYPELNSPQGGLILEKSLKKASSERMTSQSADDDDGCRDVYDACIFEAAAVATAAVLLCDVTGPASPACIAAAILVQAAMSNTCVAEYSLCREDHPTE